MQGDGVSEIEMIIIDELGQEEEIKLTEEQKTIKIDKEGPDSVEIEITNFGSTTIDVTRKRKRFSIRNI